MSHAGAGASTLVAGWVGSTNLGDELLYRSLRDQLRERGADPVAISTDPAATAREHGTAAVGHLDVPGWWRTVGTDGRLVFGGGGLLQDESSRLNVPYHLARVAVARTRGTPAVAVGLGGGELHATSRALVRAALHGVPIGARDAATVSQLRGLGLDVRRTADLAFHLAAPAVEARDELVVSLRPRPIAGSWRPAADAWRAGLPDEAQTAAVAARIEAVAHAAGLDVRFVAFQADRDGVLHRRLADRMTRVTVTCVEPGLGEVLAEVARGRAVLAMRFHAAVAGLLAGRPVLAAAYSGKVAALAEDAPGTVHVLAAPLSQVPGGALDAALRGDGDRRAQELAALRRREAGNGALLDALLAS